MNRKKLSCILTVTMIATQLNYIAFAQENHEQMNNETNQVIDSIQDININEELREDNVELTNEDETNINDELKSEVIENTGEQTENLGQENSQNVESDSIVEEVKDKLVGKLELDINFNMLIKNVGKDATKISVKLMKDANEVGVVELGKDNKQGSIGDGRYTLQALDGKRKAISDDAEELSFYHLTFNDLELGTYSIELKGDGYDSTVIKDIEIQDSSKRVKVGTSDNKIVLSDNETPDNQDDDVIEYYPGVFLAGDVDGNGVVDKVDYDSVKDAIKNNRFESRHDINKDAKVDITDLTYIHKNIGKNEKSAEISKTDAIINSNNVRITLDENKVEIGEGQNIKDILRSETSKISLSTKGVDGSEAPEISEENPISIPINLSGASTYTTNNNVLMEKVIIKAPSETRPSAGSIVIGGETYTYDESNVNKGVMRTASGETFDEIVIDLGKQVAVGEITINVTGSRGNKNLTEIAKVEFLNNVYKEIPKPDMNVPVINNFTSTTSVGNESMTIGWNHEANVTGYEIKVEELNDNGTVKSIKTYRTSENSLKITQVKPYGNYRFSIQSISGNEWVSGYKNEQEDYDPDTVGNSNLETNVNDNDGIPDNVDVNYIPKAWDSNSGVLETASNEAVENPNYFGADSIVELQVIPESRPEGPEGIKISGLYKGLNISWKAHKKAKDYDLYYRKVGEGAWIKANDPNEPKYSDSNTNNDIPDGVANLSPDEKEDSNELIRATSYEISGLEDGAVYEVKMTATNHHGTGGLSQTYLGETSSLVVPDITSYRLINTPKEDGGVNHIEKVTVNKNDIMELSNSEPMSIVDNNYDTTWVLKDWDAGVHYGQRSPIVTFDKEYTFDTIMFTTKLENMSQYPLPREAKLRVYSNDDTEYKTPIKVIERNDIKVNRKTAPNGAKYVEVKLPEAITAKQIELNISGDRNLSISEMKFYHYDSLEDDVNALFADDLRLVLKEDVTQEIIDELVTRAKTIDPISLEYHPNQERILEELEMAQNLLNDANLNKDVINIDASILNDSPNLGQGNAWQSLGVAVKPGDNISIYVGTEAGREHSEFEVLFTQNYAESGSWNSEIIKIGVGKNDIQVQDGNFDMDVEKGGNVYIRPVKGYHENQNIKVRVSGGTKIPHLNVNNIIMDKTKESEVKSMIRQYIRDLKIYVSDLPSLYPTTEDKINNQYKYDPRTSILNSTDIESERVMLTLTATEVLDGITKGLNGDENAEVNRLYDSLLAWEQIMDISYSLKGVIEKPIDFNENGKIDNDRKDTSSLIDGLTEQEYFNKHRAPRNRINVKYQRMFTGAFMYASSHHIGIDVGSGSGMVQGVPFRFDNSGKISNFNEGSLFGWGIAHEIGHVQDQPNLTQAEVTNNILAMITQTFDGTSKSRLEGGTYEMMYDKVTSGSIGATSDIASKLGMYWQLHLAYEQNETYEMLNNNKDTNPNNDSFYAKLYRLNRVKPAAPKEEGYDQVEQTFIMRASDAAKKDLREFFEKWGIVASPNTNKYLDKAGYPKETKAIYYLNDEARRRRLDTSNSEAMEKDTKVIASFGVDKNGNNIDDKTYLNQKEVPLNLSVSKDSDKVLGYEIIREEATSAGIKEVPVGFVERDVNSENGITTYVDTIDTINNRTFGYKVVAYDYDLNKTEETAIGQIKVTHDGSIGKSSWILNTNTTNNEDVRDEHSGHGTVQSGVINRIKDGDADTVFQGIKEGNQDPYVIIDLNSNKSLVGLKYTAPKAVNKKFSLKNLFKSNTEKVYKPISDYEVYTSLDGESWTLSSKGVFDRSRSEETIYFSENGSADAKQLWAYNARYVKLVAKGNTEISIAELELLTAAGDNIEIGIDNGDQVYEKGIGRLKSDYSYAEGKVIPKGSIIVTGEYTGNPAFNIPLVLNENNENFALKSKAILLATLPENSELTEVAEGNWIYWIEPQDQDKVDIGNGEEDNLLGTSIRAELYRYNKLNEEGAPIGQRLVSDTFLLPLPGDLNDLPEIELNSSSARMFSTEDKMVIEINDDLITKTFENR